MERVARAGGREAKDHMHCTYPLQIAFERAAFGCQVKKGDLSGLNNFTRFPLDILYRDVRKRGSSVWTLRSASVCSKSEGKIQGFEGRSHLNGIDLALSQDRFLQESGPHASEKSISGPIQI